MRNALPKSVTSPESPVKQGTRHAKEFQIGKPSGVRRMGKMEPMRAPRATIKTNTAQCIRLIGHAALHGRIRWKNEIRVQTFNGGAVFKVSGRRTTSAAYIRRPGSSG